MLFLEFTSVTPVSNAVLYVPGAKKMRLGLVGRRTGWNRHGTGVAQCGNDGLVGAGIAVERCALDAGIVRIDVVARRVGHGHDAH